MAKINIKDITDKIKKAKPDMDVEAEVNIIKDKLKTVSESGAYMILANRCGLKISTAPKPTLKTIDSTKSGDTHTEIAGAVVNSSGLRWFPVCPTCGKSAKEIDGQGNQCKEHGVVTPVYRCLMNVELDDSTSQMRCTLFSKQVQKLFGRNEQQIREFKEKEEEFNKIKAELFGKLLAFRGDIKSNEYSGKEMNVKLVFKEIGDVEPRIEAVKALISSSNRTLDSGDDDSISEENISPYV